MARRTKSGNPDRRYCADVRQELLAKPPVERWQVVTEIDHRDGRNPTVIRRTCKTLADAESYLDRADFDWCGPDARVLHRVVRGHVRWTWGHYRLEETFEPKEDDSDAHS